MLYAKSRFKTWNGPDSLREGDRMLSCKPTKRIQQKLLTARSPICTQWICMEPNMLQPGPLIILSSDLRPKFFANSSTPNTWFFPTPHPPYQIPEAGFLSTTSAELVKNKKKTTRENWALLLLFYPPFSGIKRLETWQGTCTDPCK